MALVASSHQLFKALSFIIWRILSYKWEFWNLCIHWNYSILVYGTRDSCAHNVLICISCFDLHWAHVRNLGIEICIWFVYKNKNKNKNNIQQLCPCPRPLPNLNPFNFQPYSLVVSFHLLHLHVVIPFIFIKNKDQKPLMDNNYNHDNNYYIWKH